MKISRVLSGVLSAGALALGLAQGAGATVVTPWPAGWVTTQVTTWVHQHMTGTPKSDYIVMGTGCQPAAAYPNGYHCTVFMVWYSYPFTATVGVRLVDGHWTVPGGLMATLSGENGPFSIMPVLAKSLVQGLTQRYKNLGFSAGTRVSEARCVPNADQGTATCLIKGSFGPEILKLKLIAHGWGFQVK